VNFLSHYYFDKKDESNPLFHLGLVFPDFLKHFTLQRFKPSKMLEKDYLGMGAQQHIIRDEHFHNHEFFDDMCSEISRYIDRTEAKKIPKTWFLAHILLEMGIDRILMEKNNQILPQFYSELEQVTKDDINIYFEHNNLAQADVFFSKLNKFNQTKWLYEYLNDEKLPISLNHVYFRIGLSEKWDAKINQALINSLPEILQIIRKGLPSYA
jgi:hypothetical protein